MSKYVTALNGKRYLMEEVLTWTMGRLKQNFDRNHRDKARATSKLRWEEHHPDLEEFKAQLRARWKDPEYKARLLPKLKAAMVKNLKDPLWVAARNAKRAATIAAKKAENPTYDEEREAKRKKALTKSKKWQEYLKQPKSDESRRKRTKEVLLAKDPDYYKKRTAKFRATIALVGHYTKRKKVTKEVLLAKDPDFYKKRTAKFRATQQANGGHWTKRKKAQAD